ncbi:unnamed protein product [Cladocopium goreaui]|uniref:Uncharacterized protein n=1 Tax=Cladocopium goreaui TaxID=2562237 RepID=A0A9P1GK86_9DINO|nr:unnamed protein product [Cladocopium goreaui]
MLAAARDDPTAQTMAKTKVAPGASLRRSGGRSWIKWRRKRRNLDLTPWQRKRRQTVA